MDIFKVRFSDKFSIIRNISEDTLDIKIPKLLIEPIVENDINHGIERVSRQGVLVINSFIKGDDFVIEVNDNGIGMKKEELNNLIERLNDEEDDAEGSIGLINVNKRIKLFYGEEYGLRIESEYDKFTKVTVKISRDHINRGRENISCIKS
ncbi:MAG: ATP-binding protein [Inconstantimicrobium porci]|uniref:sensor histidine kinase n=1 Tax=Inconstantimicrobium porci TaxID=2652291 RepID=UPI002A918CE5|nr:ATP-binding protein [Inconstantimicrobium porci]MDY5911677.1 ATP-binding protein [Inconstantimicrobium porci]